MAQSAATFFADLFPRWPLVEVPVGHVNNGVHAPTWDSLYAQRASDDNTQGSRTRFDPDTLTLGFARRFATYKRPTLLLHHPDRLARILTNPKFPVQLLIAGKAHPADEPGKAMIKQWVEFVSAHQKCVHTSSSSPTTT